MKSIKSECPRCHGFGQVGHTMNSLHRCPICYGSGTQYDYKQIVKNVIKIVGSCLSIVVGLFILNKNKK